MDNFCKYSQKYKVSVIKKSAPARFVDDVQVVDLAGGSFYFL